MQAYLPGDSGTVRHDGTVIGARVYYTVEMDGPETENIAVFAEDEIEPDL
jgi:hypothetical protein